MGGPRFTARNVFFGVVLSTGSVACALVAGLEDKQPYDVDGSTAEVSPPRDSAGPFDSALGSDASSAIGPIETVASGQGKPWGLAVDDAYVYWTNEGDETIVRAPKSGGTAAVIARDQLEPHGIVVDSTTVIWHNANFESAQKGDAGNDVFEIARLPKTSIGQDGGLPLEIESVHAGQKAHGIAIAKDPDDQLWSTWTDRLRRNRREDSNGGRDIVKPLDPREPTALAVDDVNAYFFLQAPLQVWSVPKTADGFTDAGGPIATLPGSPEVVDMATDGAALYMVTMGGAVLRLPTPDGGTATQLAVGHSFPHSIAVDDKYVYVAHSSADDGPTDGAVVMVAESGAETITLAKGQNRPRGIAVDIGLDGSHTVYWATYGDGKISRVRVR